MMVYMTPAGVKYLHVRVKYGGMYDSCRSHVSQCMTPVGVKYVGMYDSCRSQASQCMTPAGVKYVIMYVSCRSQVCHYE